MTSSSAGTRVCTEANLQQPAERDRGCASIGTSSGLRALMACTTRSWPSEKITNKRRHRRQHEGDRQQNDPSHGPHHGAAPVVTSARFATLRSRAPSFKLSDLSCPQAAMMSRPRGVRTGLA